MGQSSVIALLLELRIYLYYSHFDDYSIWGGVRNSEVKHCKLYSWKAALDPAAELTVLPNSLHYCCCYLVSRLKLACVCAYEIPSQQKQSLDQCFGLRPVTEVLRWTELLWSSWQHQQSCRELHFTPRWKHSCNVLWLQGVALCLLEICNQGFRIPGCILLSSVVKLGVQKGVKTSSMSPYSRRQA